MNRPIRLVAIAVLAAWGVISIGTSTPAQLPDIKAIVAKQKEEISTNLKKADLSKATVTETDNFFIVGTLPAEKAKALGAILEKVAPIARKALQYEPKDEVWKGKLAIYYLPESRDYKNFVRAALQMRPEGVYSDVRSDTPYLVDPVELPAKSTETEQFANTAAIVAGAYLKARGATANLPEWISSGFGKATAYRADGLNSARYLGFKKQAKALAAGTKGTPAAIAELWGETKANNADILAASLLEYMAYGPGADNFLKLVYGFRPDENGNQPSVGQALEAAGWKEVPMLESNWRKWVTAGK